MNEYKHAYIHKKEGRLAEDLAREGGHTAIVALLERVQAIYQVQQMKDASIQDYCLNFFLVDIFPCSCMIWRCLGTCPVSMLL